MIYLVNGSHDSTWIPVVTPELIHALYYTPRLARVGRHLLDSHHSTRQTVDRMIHSNSDANRFFLVKKAMNQSSFCPISFRRYGIVIARLQRVTGN